METPTDPMKQPFNNTDVPTARKHFAKGCQRLDRASMQVAQGHQMLANREKSQEKRMHTMPHCENVEVLRVDPQRSKSKEGNRPMTLKFAMKLRASDNLLCFEDSKTKGFYDVSLVNAKDWNRKGISDKGTVFIGTISKSDLKRLAKAS